MSSHFDRFRDAIAKGSPTMDYPWSKGKEASCQWIVDRIPSGKKVVDIGGTEWMCSKLQEKGCDVTYYDLVPPKSFEKSIQADMFDVLEHFAAKSVDVITTRHTLEHSLCPMFQLWSYNQLLKDGGRLFVIVPTHIREWIWYGTHHSCLPMENWICLFYRSGFKVVTADAGTWAPTDVKYIEHRFELAVENRELRLSYQPQWLPF